LTAVTLSCAAWALTAICSATPQQNSGNSENDSEKRRNGVSVVVHELAAASPIEFKRNSEIGDAFYRMLCAGLVFAAIYAGLKCLRTPNHPSGKNKKDDS
jgi:hypothetical protein